jgi:hypothetical protein
MWQKYVDNLTSFHPPPYFSPNARGAILAVAGLRLDQSSFRPEPGSKGARGRDGEPRGGAPRLSPRRKRWRRCPIPGFGVGHGRFKSCCRLTIFSVVMVPLVRKRQLQFPNTSKGLSSFWRPPRRCYIRSPRTRHACLFWRTVARSTLDGVSVRRNILHLKGDDIATA